MADDRVPNLRLLAAQAMGKVGAKAKACVEGRRLLYAYCAERGVSYRRCGKLLVATAAEELPALSGIVKSYDGNVMAPFDANFHIIG